MHHLQLQRCLVQRFLWEIHLERHPSTPFERKFWSGSPFGCADVTNLVTKVMLILSKNYHPQATMKAEVSLLSIPCPPSFVLFKFHRRKNKRGKHFSINTKWNAMQQLYVVWSSHFIKSSNIHSYFRLIHHKYLCACIPTKSLSSFVSSSITYLTKQCFFFFHLKCSIHRDV